MARPRDKQKEAQWRRLVRERAASGWSVAEFCSRRRIPAGQYYWWQRRLLNRDGHEAKSDRASQPASFVQVRIPLTLPAVEVVHPSGCLIRVTAGVDAGTLRGVLEALSATEE
jgi:hypothetical protein